MNADRKVEIKSNGFPIARMLHVVSASSGRSSSMIGIVARSLGLVVVAASIAGLPGPGFAQEAIQAEGTRTPFVSEVQRDSVRHDSPQPIRSAPEPGAALAASTAPNPAAATITGTVEDVNGDLVPGATIVLSSASAGDRREAIADDNAAFKFDSVTPGIPYEVIIELKGFTSWKSASIVLAPSQFLILNDIHLKLEAEATSIIVHGSTEGIATEQIQVAEQQRVLGIIPNFYAVYDGANTVPLTPKLKFKLAMRVSVDPITLVGVGLMSGINQAANRPDYVQGAKGYGQRLGAESALGFSDILLGGAILPSLLHQDPRYFYQGTGGTQSRLIHAIGSPFICRGDNGRRQINFSSIGGDLGSTALSMTYYPASNRGVGEVFTTFGISTAERTIAAIAQEFIIPHFTPSLKRRK
jgi:hypothetical protein